MSYARIKARVFDIISKDDGSDRASRNFDLLIMSLIVLIHWELMYAKHPERFWSGSNRTLQCSTCKERTCQIKKRLWGGNNSNSSAEQKPAA